MSQLGSEAHNVCANARTMQVLGGNAWEQRNCWRNCWTFAFDSLDSLDSLDTLITCGYHVTTCDNSWHLRSVNYCTSEIGSMWYQSGLVLGRQRSAPVLLGAQQVSWIQMWLLHLDDFGWTSSTLTAHIQNRLPWSLHVWVRTWGSQGFVVKSWAVSKTHPWNFRSQAAQNPAGQGAICGSDLQRLFHQVQPI